jgi:S1-C subfamily serine protease
MHRYLSWVLPALLVAGLCGACSIDLTDDTSAATTMPPPDVPSSTASSTVPPTRPDLYDVSDLVDAVAGGVVSVTSSQVRFDFLGTPQEVPAGTGTGIVVDDDLILTNHHVVAGADALTVVGRDARPRAAEVVDRSPGRDLALLRVDDGNDLTPLVLGSLDHVDVGDPAVAIGNALGLDASRPSVSVGIVSALGRSIRTGDGLLEDLVQTDAAINPGNSGGPLLDGLGRVIGVNTAVAGGPAQNVGFAISIDTASRFIERFRSGVGEPFLGVVLADNSPAVAERIGLSVDGGAIVVEVVPGGPADRAGIQEWDVITSFAGDDVADSATLGRLVFDAAPGTEVSAGMVRDGERLDVTVTIGERDVDE